MDNQFGRSVRRYAAALLVAGMGVAGSASATLIDRGSGLIYDTGLDITWVQDASLCVALGNCLNRNDNAALGGMKWADANTWAENLVYGGFSDWRLPYASVNAGAGPIARFSEGSPSLPRGNPCISISDCGDNEMAYMYYVNMQRTFLSDRPFNPLGTVNVGGVNFTNVQPIYWSGTAALRNIDADANAWFFTFTAGNQDIFLKPNLVAAWAVRPGDVLGVTQALPIQPTTTQSDGTFVFTHGRSGRYFDPDTAFGYHYEMTSGSLFTDILNFPTGFDSNIKVTTPGCTLSGSGSFGAGSSVDFSDLCGFDVSSFDITGLNPLVDPANPLAFPVQLAFNTSTADFTMTPLTPQSGAAPEPATLALLALGLAGLGFSRRVRIAQAA